MSDETKGIQEENKTAKKAQSRKFIVWIVSVLVFLVVMFVSFINEMGDEVTIKAIEFITWTTALYLGANVGSKFADAIKTNNEDKN